MSQDPALIIYDGDCIYCQNYVRLVRLRDAVGPVELIDARSGDSRVKTYWDRGFDLDEGMLFVYKGVVHHGAEALNVMAALSSRSSVANRLNALAFSNRTVARLSYPLLKLGRRLTLLARGRDRLTRSEDAR